MFTLHASGVGIGIAIGKALIIQNAGHKISNFLIDLNQVEAEISRLDEAFRRAKEALKKTQDELTAEAPEGLRSLLALHLMLLEDSTLMKHPADLIRGRQINAERALAQHAAKLDYSFKNIQDPYLSTKSADVAQVIHRVQSELVGTNSVSDFDAQLDGVLPDQIIVTNNLSPADAINLRHRCIGGFITDLGGPISHTAILARSMQIPAIVGMHNALCYLRTGDSLIIDGKRGVVFVNPDDATLVVYQRRREKIRRRNTRDLDALRKAESISIDGQAVAMLVNIKLPEEAVECPMLNAHGIGLYRTEFMFMKRAEIPDEEEQLAVYAEVIRKTQRTVTIRTLDLGADKHVDGVRGGNAMIVNPALGRRAIRLCLNDIALFKPQLRALYRASAIGSIKIMVPMISNLEEVNQLFALIDQVKRELTREGHEFNPNTPVGGMIEVPAAAISADLFARRLDFLSIGTNDLIQYTLAIDRIDDEVNYLYDPLHPSVLRLIQNTIDAGKNVGIPISMCGEMAGDTRYTRLLLAMGLREFSMEAASLLEVKQQIRLTDISRLTARVTETVKIGEPEKIKQMVMEINQ